MNELLSLKWKNHGPAFQELLGTLRQKQIYTDVTLACSGKFYSAHRLILTACSDYFRDICEHLDCNKPVIVLRDINCDNLEALLDYMYIGEVSVKQSNLSSLIKAAECLNIKGLAVAIDEPTPNTSKKQSNTTRFNTKRKVTDRNTDISDSTKPSKYIKNENLVHKSEEQFNIDDNENHFKQNNIYVKQEIEVQSENDSIDIDKVVEETFLDDKICDINFGASGSNAPTVPYQGNTEWQDSDSNMADSLNDYGAVENVDNISLVKSKRCTFCPKTFRWDAELLRHLRIHTGEMPYHCPYCTYKANVKGNLKKHIIVIHHTDIFMM